MSRTYVVGLPVVVTIYGEAEGAWVTVEVDLTELGASIHEDTANIGLEEALQVLADADLLDEWASVHSVRNEGHAHHWTTPEVDE